jgi:hypothetical protein
VTSKAIGCAAWKAALITVVGVVIFVGNGHIEVRVLKLIWPLAIPFVGIPYELNSTYKSDFWFFFLLAGGWVLWTLALNFVQARREKKK